MHTQSIKEMNGKFECIKISKKKKMKMKATQCGSPKCM